MNFHESVNAELVTDGTVSGLIGNRVYPLLIPQASLNEASRHGCLVFSRIGVQRSQTLCGQSRLIASSLQLDAYAGTFGQAIAIAKAARQRLVDFEGELGGSGGILVKTISLETELELQDPDPGLYRISQTYTVWHLED